MPDDAHVTDSTTLSIHTRAKILVEQDSLLEAVRLAQTLPEGDATRTEVETLAAHAASPEAYRNHYRTMRGDSCPENDLFTRHLLVKRFAGIRERVLARKQMRVLDLGCLDGWCLLNLAAGGVTGVGVDLSPAALAVGRARAEKYGFPLWFVEGAVEDFDVRRAFENAGKEGGPPREFDAVFLSEILEHVLDPVACLRTAAKHLAPGGVVYVSAPATAIPHHGNLEDAVLHLRVLSEADLRAAARDAGLHVVVDHELLPQQDQGQSFSHRLISFRRARAAIYCNHVTGGWDPADLGSLNASEEAVVRVAEQWARDGHEVRVWQNGADTGTAPACAEWEDGTAGYARWHNGVKYLPRETPPPEDLDCLVLFKTLDRHELPARVKVFWTTDLPAPGAGATFLPPVVAERLDQIICISEWHRQRLLEACPWVPAERVTAHWVGVDPEEIRAAREAVPAPIQKRAVYASSLDRGAADLLRMWPRVRERVPGAELRVLYGLEFWRRSEAVLQEPGRSQMKQQRLDLERLLAQPGVVFGRAPTREEYLRELASASVWAYPCTGGELCCKVALEVQALGVLPVVIPTMALSETVIEGVGVKCESLADFESKLVSALQLEYPPESIRAWLEIKDSKIPSWADLATHLWQPIAAALDVATLTPSVPAEMQPKETPLPERFRIPARKNINRYGLDILMHVNGMPFDGETDRKASLGGSETAALQLSRALAKRGHHVTVFSNCQKPAKFDKVTYIPIGEFPRYVGHTPHDVCVVQRDPTVLNMPVTSKLNVLWMHDLGLTRYVERTRASLWNTDYVVPVSHWHGRQLCEVYGLEPEVIAPMRNGVEADRALKYGQRRKHNPKLLVYAARPERGLRLLLERVFPRLLERDPDLVLALAGYENTVPEMQPFYDFLNSLCDGYGKRVQRVGALTKDKLYELYSSARAYCYPTEDFEEVSCISLQETAACGLPFVGSARGALPETAGYCPNHARLVPHPGSPTDQYVRDFVEATWETLSDDLLNEKMRRAGLAGAKVYDWAGVAEEWETFLLGAIEERNDSRERLVKHLWRIGDTYGAARALDDAWLDDPPAGRLAEVVAWEKAPDVPPTEVPPSVLNAVANAVGGAKPKTIFALAPESRSVAQQIAALFGATVVDAAPADLVLGVETLDCAPDPEAHIKAAEQSAAPDGMVCLAAAGPAVQQHRLHQGAPRGGRWVFDQHDIRELLSGKRDLLALVVGGGGISAYDGFPLSWSVYAWKRGSGPTGKLDFTRRLALQAPRLSLAATMITQNTEGMLTRCLQSFRPYVDEIVVADGQSTDATRALLAQAGATVVEGIDPKIHGFDAARNVVLPYVTGDVVLWIDSDEELLDGQNLPKYLRWNMFGGYALRQHHFSAVPENAFKPDLPVRLFRRTWPAGKPSDIRWFGVVHEHPETKPNESVGESICLSDVHIGHFGYLTETVRRGRFGRNIPLMFRDRAKYPERTLGKMLMIRDWAHLARYNGQQAGGQLTPDAAAHYEAALAAYQRDFLGKAHALALDGLQYYNEACTALGRGFDVDIVLRVAWPGGGSRDVTYRGRVASLEDLEKMLAGYTKDLGDVWKGKYL